MEGFSFTELLIVVLIGLLFAKDTAIAWVSKKLGITSDIPDWANSLINHVNHAQTDILTEIRDNTKVLPEIHKHAETTANKLEELEKYGFPPRGCENK